jgi:hypothetical protein
MRLGIMQPYFFPYLGHFGLIANTDRWIVFDVTQYTPRTWMNRNRVLHPTEGWNYVTVPLANSSTQIRIHEARIADPRAAARSIEGKLSHYRRKAPHYETVRRLVAGTFAAAGDSLVELDVQGLQAVCRYLDIPLRLEVCSRMGLALPQHLEPGDWALEICTQLGADAYLNPASGRALFDPQRYAGRGVALQFLEVGEFRYDTGPYPFEPGLSILDVMLWNSPQQIRDALELVCRCVPAL